MLLRKFLLILITSCVVLVGCSSNKETYSRDEVNRVQTKFAGNIENITVVNVSGKSSWIGSTTGSIAGGLLGSLIGNGWGRVATSIVGSVAGGLAGSGVEKQLTKGQGLKLDIRLDNGEGFSTVIVPEKNQHFNVGDRVQVASSTSGVVEITLMPQAAVAPAAEEELIEESVPVITD